jgi:hypothetical protein
VAATSSGNAARAAAGWSPALDERPKGKRRVCSWGRWGKTKESGRGRRGGHGVDGAHFKPGARRWGRVDGVVPRGRRGLREGGVPP